MFQNFDYYSVCSVFSLLNLFYFLENELKIVKKKKKPICINDKQVSWNSNAEWISVLQFLRLLYS